MKVNPLWYCLQVRVPSKTAFKLRSRDVIVNIQKRHLTVGIKGQPPIIDDDLQHEIKVEECTWLLEDGKTFLINLEKVSFLNYFSLPVTYFLGNVTPLMCQNFGYRKLPNAFLVNWKTDDSIEFLLTPTFTSIIFSFLFLFRQVNEKTPTLLNTYITYENKKPNPIRFVIVCLMQVLILHFNSVISFEASLCTILLFLFTWLHFVIENWQYQWAKNFPGTVTSNR